MRSSPIILSALFALTAQAAPTTPEDGNHIASRDSIEFCAVTGDSVKLRTCPTTDCDYVEEWPYGTKVAFSCRMKGYDDVYT